MHAFIVLVRDSGHGITLVGSKLSHALTYKYITSAPKCAFVVYFVCILYRVDSCSCVVMAYISSSHSSYGAQAAV